MDSYLYMKATDALCVNYRHAILSELSQNIAFDIFNSIASF